MADFMDEILESMGAGQPQENADGKTPPPQPERKPEDIGFCDEFSKAYGPRSGKV
jgi:hypothetical protein